MLKKNVCTALLGAALATVAISGAWAGPESPTPNLVFVFSDQQSSDMLGCYGNEDIITPNLDKLAAEGVRFNHCISSSPICTPYRAMLLSGQHTLKNGAIGNDIRMLPGKGKYFAEVLRDSGFRTAYVGKWHLYGGDRNRPIPPGEYRYGFDGFFLSNNCTLVYDPERSYYWDDNGTKQHYGDWEQYAQARQAIDFIKDHAKKDKDVPFALFLSWHPPHRWATRDCGGYGAPEDMLALYDEKTLKLRPNVGDSAGVRAKYKGHYALISSIDKAFGWLMDALEKQGLDENTIIVYTSDHGDALSSHSNYHCKMRPEKESIRVPLIIRYPEKLQPRTSDLPVGTLDLMPTLLGMMDLPVPETCDGLNLSKPIYNADDNAVDSVPIFLPERDFRGVYTPRYTYCYDSFDPKETSKPSERDRKHPPSRFDWNVLYDRQVDPAEKTNFFHDPAYKEIREDLHKKTTAWMEKVGDDGWSYTTIRAALVNHKQATTQTVKGYKRPVTMTERPLDTLKGKGVRGR